MATSRDPFSNPTSKKWGIPLNPVNPDHYRDLVAVYGESRAWDMRVAKLRTIGRHHEADKMERDKQWVVAA